MFERICLILIANFIFFFKTLYFGYCSDDIPAYKNTPKNINKWKKLFFQIEGRYKVAPQQDHAITLIIHALVCVFIYLAFGASDISFLASFLFSFNPINNQGSVWLSGRPYVIPTLFILMSMSINNPFLLIPATYYNIGFVFPVVFIGSRYWWFVFILPICWYLNYMRFFKSVKEKTKQESFAEDKIIHPKKLILAFKTFGFYTAMALVPIRTTFYHAFLHSMAGNVLMVKKAYSLEKYFFIGVATSVAILTYWIIVPWNLTSFCLLWWIFGLAPFLNLFRIQQEIAERYVYLPSIGLMMVLATILIQFPIIASWFLAMYATKLWFYMNTYKDDFTLVETSAINDPSAWFVWHMKALKRWDNQSYKEALTYWIMAKNISPHEFKVLFNIAIVLKKYNNVKEANQFIELAQQHIPRGQEIMAKQLIEDFKQGKEIVLI